MPKDRFPLTPEQRKLRARVAALSLHARTDGHHHTEPARRAFMSRFERVVDPNGLLPEDERKRRASIERTRYFAQLAYRSSRMRQQRAVRMATEQERP